MTKIKIIKERESKIKEIKKEVSKEESLEEEISDLEAQDLKQFVSLGGKQIIISPTLKQEEIESMPAPSPARRQVSSAPVQRAVSYIPQRQQTTEELERKYNPSMERPNQVHASQISLNENRAGSLVMDSERVKRTESRESKYEKIREMEDKKPRRKYPWEA